METIRIVALLFVVGLVGVLVHFFYNAAKQSLLDINKDSAAHQLLALLEKYYPGDFCRKYSTGGNALDNYKFHAFNERSGPRLSSLGWSAEDIARYHELVKEFLLHDEKSREHFRKNNPAASAGSPVGQILVDAGLGSQTTPEVEKSAAGAMVKGAVVGSIVAGTPGAVVGAMVGKEMHDSKKK